MKPVDYSLDDDIAAIATPLAPSALGIVRTSGKGCIERAAQFFSRPQALLNAAGHSIVYGWLYDHTTAVDEVVICVYRSPKSNTGEDSVEIICHGGPSVVKAVYNLCIKNGFRAAERGEFTFRSFINGKTDLTRAEAVKEIIDSKTGLAREKAAGRLSGSVFEEIDRIKSGLMTVLAALEVGIEYPEDEETIADSFDFSLLDAPLHALRLLYSSWKSEKIYQDGLRIVLAGRTNAGKSSLFNALLKEDRAIVSDIHGTTRDWLEASLDFKGIPVTIFDTAGIRVTDDTIEAIGVQRSIDLIAAADAVLYLIDGTAPLSHEDTAFMTQSSVPVIRVYTKADSPDFCEHSAADSGTAAVCISSKTGEGIEQLITLVTDTVVQETASVSEALVSLGTERQQQGIAAALDLLTHAADAAHKGFPLDAVAQDIEDTIHVLGNITGEVRADDILDRIFSGFCVGK